MVVIQGDYAAMVHPKVHPTMERRTLLTKSQIDRALREATSETTLNDHAAGRGSLRLRIRPGKAGVSAVWLGFWKSAGRRASKQLGRYPDMSLADARQRFASEVRTVLQAGRNPRVAVATAERPTVQALFTAYLAALRLRGARRAEEIERTLMTGKYAAADALGRDRLAGDVMPEDVSAFLAEGFARGARRQTDICRTYMAAAFNWGIRSTHDYRAKERRDWGIRANPVSMVPRDAEANKTRDRNLSAVEIRAVWHAAPGLTGDVLRLVLATGQRVIEVVRVDGSEIDLAAGLWRMPAHKTKGRKRAHVIPLPRQAVEIFASLKAIHGDGPLFPARAGAAGELIGLASISRAASRLNVCEPFQPRDLRRTWKTRAHDAGIDRFTRDLIQQHAQNGDTGSRHYDRSDYGPQMRAATDKWGEWLQSAISQ